MPSQFRVLVTRRPKYACRACENGITQAPAKPNLIEGGIPTEATLATIAINKHADHLHISREALRNACPLSLRGDRLTDSLEVMVTIEPKLGFYPAKPFAHLHRAFAVLVRALVNNYLKIN